MIEYFAETKLSRRRVKFELDLPNYPKKQIQKMEQVSIHQILLKNHLANSKCNVYKLDIDKLKMVPTYLRNQKSKIYKLDVDKLVPVPVVLRKVSHVVKDDV